MIQYVVLGVIAGLLLLGREAGDDADTNPLASADPDGESRRPRTHTVEKVVVREYVRRPRRKRKGEQSPAPVAESQDDNRSASPDAGAGADNEPDPGDISEGE